MPGPEVVPVHVGARQSPLVVAVYMDVAILRGLWEGLPTTLVPLVASWGDVLIGQTLVGTIGLVILWRRWREAMRLQLLQEGTAC